MTNRNSIKGINLLDALCKIKMDIRKYSYEYKDNTPIKTIETIRNRFAKKNIILQEHWNQTIQEFYSVQICIPGTTISANGKGRSEELALASAYGELVERVSLLLPYRVSVFRDFFYKEMQNNLLHQNGTEPFIQINTLEWLKSNSLEYFLAMVVDKSTYEFEKVLEDWKKYLQRDDSVILGVFQELNSKTKEKICIPTQIIDYYYGSNGMCAGNTREEALVQGICEIIERDVQKKILLESELLLYDITSDYFEEHANENMILNELNELKYSIRLLLCDTDYDIPVVAAILYNNKGYYVSFGCHPCVYVAIERAISELFQGYNKKQYVKY